MAHLEFAKRRITWKWMVSLSLLLFQPPPMLTALACPQVVVDDDTLVFPHAVLRVAGALNASMPIFLSGAQLAGSAAVLLNKKTGTVLAADNAWYGDREHTIHPHDRAPR